MTSGLEPEDAVNGRCQRRPRVLIVDDDTVVRMLLQEICEEYGWNVVDAASPVEAIRAAELHQLDLVLLDFHLGDDGDGLDLLGRLHALCPTTPIVVVTGESPEELGVAIRQAGGDGVVGKPCSVAQVAALLGRYRPTTTGSMVSS
jgi:two-component system, OmpR family, response regulator